MHECLIRKGVVVAPYTKDPGAGFVARLGITKILLSLMRPFGKGILLVLRGLTVELPHYLIFTP